MKTPCSRLVAFAVTALVFSLTVSWSQTTFEWSGGGADDNFNTADNWTNGVAPSASTTNAYLFTGSTRLTPVLSGGSYFASVITFDASAGAFTVLGDTASSTARFRVPAAGGMTISQLSENNQQINAILLANNQQLILVGDGSGTLTLGGLRATASQGGSIIANRDVVFADGFMTTGGSTTNLTYFVGSTNSANATFSSDPFNQLAGNRLIQMGSTSTTPGVDSTLTIAGDFTTAGSINVRSGFGGASGTATISGSGAATFSNLTFEGNAGRTLHVNNTNTTGTTFNGTVTLGGSSLGRTNTFDVASNAKLTLSGSVADGAAIGGLTKSGAGALILSGSNTYTGTTTVGAGSLIVNGTNSGPGVLNVAVGATLGGSGRIAGDTTISGNLQPGNSAGLLAFDGGLTLNSTAVTTMEIDGAGLRGTAYDAVNVEGLLTYGGDLILSFGTTFSAGSYSFDLFDFGSTDGSFDSVQLGGLYSGLFDDLGAGVWGRTSGDDTWTFSQGDGVLALEVVPEPSTYALLVLAAAGLGANVLRRRCSRW